MEHLCTIFPVDSAIILNNLDDQNVTNLKVASKDLNYFLDKEKYIPMRKKQIRDVNFCSESWIKAVKRTQVDNFKKFCFDFPTFLMCKLSQIIFRFFVNLKRSELIAKWT